MTNHDFWMSISDIINEGFTSEGLAKLDDYAEQFSTGKILYKRKRLCVYTLPFIVKVLTFAP